MELSIAQTAERKRRNRPVIPVVVITPVVWQESIKIGVPDSRQTLVVGLP